MDGLFGSYVILGAAAHMFSNIWTGCGFVSQATFLHTFFPLTKRGSSEEQILCTCFVVLLCIP